jgi:TatD DNase family protein
VLNIHTHFPTYNPEIQEVINRHQKEQELPLLETRMYSVGLHPWFLDKNTLETDFNWVQNTAKLSQVKYIGECGLDTLIDAPMQWQEEVFIRHITLSEMLQKPMILHCVRTHERILHLRKQNKATQDWIFHGFDKNLQRAQKCIDAGCCISFGAAMFKNEARFKELLQNLPSEKIYFETDMEADLKIEDVYAFANWLIG